MIALCIIDCLSLSQQLSSRWRAKISDFGESKVYFTSIATKITGTIQWSASEVLNSRRYSFGSDVWSFATVILELLCYVSEGNRGKYRYPYGELNDFQVITVIQKGHSPLVGRGSDDHSSNLLSEGAAEVQNVTSLSQVEASLRPLLREEEVKLLGSLYSIDPHNRPSMDIVLEQIKELFKLDS